MNLLLTGCFRYSDFHFQILKSLGFTVYYLQQESSALPIQENLVDATVCNSLFLYHNIDLFTNLKLIQLTSAGFDRVPLDKIKNRNIQILNARGVYSNPMAEWVVFRILEYYKKGRYFNEKQEKGKWEKNRGLRELCGKHVAIIGAGNIGQEVARRLSAFEMVVVGFDIHTNPTNYFERLYLSDSLLEHTPEFDVIVVTAPLLPSTRGLVSRQVLSSLKHDAIIVNVARGGIIDQEALYQTLSNRKDIFAAVDVFDQEPLPPESPFWKLDNIAISPHNSFVSDGTDKRMFELMRQTLESFSSATNNLCLQ